MAKKTETRRADNFAEEQHDGREVGNKSPFEADTCSNSSTVEGVDPKHVQLSKALMWASRAMLWQVDCPEAWQAFEGIAASCIAEGRRLSGDMLSDHIKRKDYTSHRTGKTVTLNNTLLPYFVRMLLREHPELKVELRASFFDVLFGEVE